MLYRREKPCRPTSLSFVGPVSFHVKPSRARDSRGPSLTLSDTIVWDTENENTYIYITYITLISMCYFQYYRTEETRRKVQIRKKNQKKKESLTLSMLQPNDWEWRKFSKCRMSRTVELKHRNNNWNTQIADSLNCLRKNFHRQFRNCQRQLEWFVIFMLVIFCKIYSSSVIITIDFLFLKSKFDLRVMKAIIDQFNN